MDDVSAYNKERWEELAAAGVKYARPMLDLNRASWYGHPAFQVFVRQLLAGDLCFLDLLEPGPVRAHYARLVTEVRRGRFDYQSEYPKRLVTFLAFESFLRGLVGADFPELHAISRRT